MAGEGELIVWELGRERVESWEEEEEEEDDDDEDEDEDEGARVTAAYPVVHPKATAEHVPCQDRSGAWPNHEPTLLNLLTPSLDPC